MDTSTLYSPTVTLPGQDQRYLGPGVVIGTDDPDHLQVALPSTDDPVRAELAAPGIAHLKEGERVLVSVTGAGTAYVIGVLGRGRRRIATRGGASTEVISDAEGERVEIRDSDGALVFTYDPDLRRAELNVPDGSLDVQAPRGDLTFRAGGAVRLSGKTVELSATSAIRAFVHHAATRVFSALHLAPGSARLDADTLRLQTRRTRVRTDDVRIRSRAIDTEADEIRTTAGRIRVTADAVTQRFGSLCRRVKGLFEGRAGRVRTLISGSWRTRAERADLRTRDTFKVDGRKIHLG